MYELFTVSIFLKDSLDEDQVSHSSSRLSRSPLKGVKKAKIMQCKVTLLDNSDYTIDVEVSNWTKVETKRESNTSNVPVFTHLHVS